MFSGSNPEERESRSLMTGLNCDPAEDMAKQQFKEETDINEIVRRFGITGTVPSVFKMPLGPEFQMARDFHSSMNAIREAEETFMTLPAQMRKRFNNDPGALIAFMSDEQNKDEAIKLGLVKPPPEKDRAGLEVPPSTAE